LKEDSTLYPPKNGLAETPDECANRMVRQIAGIVAIVQMCQDLPAPAPAQAMEQLELLLQKEEVHKALTGKGAS
jgi:hypothetical protein